MIKLYFALFILCCSITFAQNKDTISETQKFTKKINKEYSANPEKGLEILEEYLEKNKKELLSSPENLELVYYELSNFGYRSYDFNKTKEYYDLGTALIKNNNLKTPLFYYHNTIGAYFAMQGKPDSSAFYFLKAVDDLKARGQDDTAEMIKFNIGTIYYENGNYSRAIEYLEEVYDYFLPKIETNRNFPQVLGVLSSVYLKADSINKSKATATKAIKYGEKADNKFGYMYGYLNLSKVYQLNQSKDSAIYFARKAYDIANEKGLSDFGIETTFNLSKILGNYYPEEALTYGLDVKERMNGVSYSRDLGNINDHLSKLYFATGKYKEAAILQKQYIKEQDSLFTLKSKKEAQEILEKYETAEKELKIAEQEAEITQKENQKKTYAIIAVSLGILALLGFLYFRQRQKTQKQQIFALENEKENVALRSLMAGEEQERSRIAKELHDGLGGILAAAKMHASKLTEDTKVIELLDTASKESRRISHNLLPESLMKKGLDKALKDFIASINESGLLKADYQSINLSNELPQSLQLSVYRIIQELINNIIKHSGATEALVQLQQEAKKLIVTVEDNGKGFAHKDASKGIGLQNIESRLSLLKGKLEIDSAEAKGTSVYIELELEK